MKKLFFLFINLTLLLGCSGLLMDDFDNSTLKIRDFEKTWLTVYQVYPYFEFKKIDWDSLHTVYKLKVEAAKGDEYAYVLYNLLCELKDGHIALRLPSGVELSQETRRQVKDKNSFDLNVAVEYLDGNYKWTKNGMIGFATIGGSIGYMFIASFGSDTWYDQGINDIVNQLSQFNGLIIDVRNNGGGNEMNSNIIISHFLKNDLQTPGNYYNNVYRKGQVISPNKPCYDKNVVVLTNGGCFSSNEHFVMNMQQIENVVLVGDTTGGGSGYPAYYPLPSGIQIRVSRVNYLQYNQTPIEWNGIVPDILLPQTKEDVKNKKDKQLEYAIGYLKE